MGCFLTQAPPLMHFNITQLYVNRGYCDIEPVNSSQKVCQKHARLSKGCSRTPHEPLHTPMLFTVRQHRCNNEQNTSDNKKITSSSMLSDQHDHINDTARAIYSGCNVSQRKVPGWLGLEFVDRCYCSFRMNKNSSFCRKFLHRL